MKLGTRVRIVSGLAEFVGQTGVVVDHEKDCRTLMNRVRLDVPVNIPGVGVVDSDLWSNEFLRVCR